MKNISAPAKIAGVVAVIVAIIQFLSENWQALESLLLALGVSPEVADTVQTVVTAALTILAALGVYNADAIRAKFIAVVEHLS